MGLEEKRYITEHKSTNVPKYENAFKERIGAAVPIEVDWATFEQDLEGLKSLSGACLDRLEEAINWVSNDQTGKDALKDGLKKIRIVNSKNKGEKKVSMDGGVLTYTGAFGQGGYYEAADLKEAIEKSL